CWTAQLRSGQRRRAFGCPETRAERGSFQARGLDGPVADCLIRYRRPSIRPAARSDDNSESRNQEKPRCPGRLSGCVTTRGCATDGGVNAEADITTLGGSIARAPDRAPAAVGGGGASQPSGPWGTAAGAATAPMDERVGIAAGTAAAKELPPGVVGLATAPPPAPRVI